MGYDDVRREPGEAVIDALRRWYPEDRIAVLAIYETPFADPPWPHEAVGGRTFVIATRCEGVTAARVVIVRSVGADGFGAKEIGEHDGPAVAWAPPELMALLDPPENALARDWRKRAAKAHAVGVRVTEKLTACSTARRAP